MRGRDLFVVSAQYQRTFLRRRLRVSYVAEATPLALATKNHTGRFVRIPDKRGFWVSPGTLESAVGVGFAPLGIELALPVGRHLRLFTTAVSGVLVFDEPVPFRNATRFNFSAALGAGAEVTLGRSWGAGIEYRTHHLSNAGLGEENPGLDARLWLFRVRRDR